MFLFNCCYLKITYPVGIFQCIVGFVKISRGWTDATDHQGLSIPSKRILSKHIVNIRSVQAASQEHERWRGWLDTSFFICAQSRLSLIQ